MASFLEAQSWDYFLTVTFAVPRHAHQAVATLNSIRNTLVATDGPALLHLATEPHRSGTLHVHGLYKKADGSSITAAGLWEPLFRRYGRSKVETPRNQHSTARYVAKYVIKSEGEWLLA